MRGVPGTAIRDIGETMRSKREGGRLEHGLLIRSERREESARVVATGRDQKTLIVHVTLFVMPCVHCINFCGLFRYYLPQTRRQELQE